MKNLYKLNLVGKVGVGIAIVLSLLHINLTPLKGQCPPTTISGKIFLDTNQDGVDDDDVGLSGIRVRAFDAEGLLAGSVVTDEAGDYSIASLVDGEEYKIVFNSAATYVPSKVGVDNGTSVQFIQAPYCEASYAMTEAAAACGLDAHMVLTCFVQGEVTENAEMPTIVGTDYGFNSGSTKRMYATHGETGSIWGMAWKHSTKELFTGSFIKQLSGLKNGPYSLFKTTIKEGNETVLYANLADFSEDLKGLTMSDVSDCSYGDQVGRIGLGGMDITEDQRYIYIAVLDNNQIAKIPTDGNVDGEVEFYDVPAPQDLPDGEEYRVFAMKVVGDKVYVGATITGAVTKKSSVSRAVVYEFNTDNKGFKEIFSTPYLKGFWQDDNPASRRVSQWLTDIDFTDDGNMILGLSDRIGHRYCTSTNSRLDEQEPDILMVGYDAETGKWSLENNGQVAGLTGSGVGNGEGPGGGEFFGDDFFPNDPLYHNNVALGSVTVLPGTNSVVAAVFDPLYNTYSGGVHRYSTVDGKRLGEREFYTDNYDVAFGKASGFGDLVVLCGNEYIQVGNYVWVDENSDGIQDAGEPVVGGADVVVYNDKCEIVESVTTDENGQYLLSSILANTDYYVTVGANIKDASSGWYTGGGYTTLIPTTGGASADQGSEEMTTSSCAEAGFSLNAATNNYDFDFGFKPVTDFDLALTKKLIGSPYLKMGDLRTFEITVFNQGVVAAQNVEITDYLTDGYIFSESNNPGWSRTGDQLTYTVTDVINPGENTSVEIRLAIANNRYADFINVAEISSGEDQSGETRDDVDSTPDNEKDNDKGGEVDTSTDDSITGDDDEDDQDPATGKIFDLALKIELKDDRIYYAGENVTFIITVFNQGEVDAQSFKIANYVPQGLFPTQGGNAGWTTSIGRMSYEDDTVLPAGTSRTYEVEFTTGKFFREGNLDNYAEITESIPVGSEESIDFDSTPDDIADNDAGGQPLSTTDNVTLADPAVDEDDHDPVRIRTQFFDLALIKKARRVSVKEGDDITFDITVYNQGTAPVDQVTIVDYIPEHLILIDDAWTMLPDNMAKITVDLESPLMPEQNFTTSVRFALSDEAPKGTLIVNYAEISGFGFDGEDYSDFDVDSDPDIVKENDPGGVVSTTTDDSIFMDPLDDEDDQDPAAFVVLDFDVEEECLSNATTYNDGQFEDSFRVLGVSGVEWTVDEAVNYYDETSADPPGDPTEIVEGVAMTETPIGGSGLSFYRFSAKRVEDLPARIVFRSEADDLFVYETPGSRYRSLEVDGAQAVCNGGEEDYTITNGSATETYTWTLPSGTELTGTTVTINWDDEEAGEIMIEGDGCSEPLTMTVSDEGLDEGLMCHDHKYISLDENCEAVITADMIYAGSLDPEVLVVMLLDENGEVIPNATLTSEYVGRTVEAKVMDGCGSNSCWGYLTVEDKVAPVIECRDYDLECNKLHEFEGPFATDNCDGIVMEIITESVPEVFDCDPDYAGRLTRRYVAEDAYGNRSEPCDITINLNRIDFDLITTPGDYTMISDNGPLTCQSYATDENGNPALSVTGSPMYYDAALFPELENNLCNIMTWYSDKVDIDEGTIKITRTFNVWEMHCDVENPVQYIQRIDIVDNERPVITCPSDMTVSANRLECMATFTLPEATATDICSEGIRYTISNDDTGFIDSGDSRVVSLPYRTEPYEFVYRAIDDSGNISAPCSMFVTIEDEYAPTVICDSHTAVGIGNSGQGKLYATAVDDGTYDYCEVDFIKISRMDDDLDGDPNNPLWQDYILFTCDDVGSDNMVVLGAWDLAGNFNQCMVNVEVQDKTRPDVTAPADMEIECTDEIFPLSQFGDADVFDICEATLTIDSIINIDPLCKTGTITRIFTVTDGTNVSQDRQIIEVVNSNPFDLSNVTFPPNYYTEDICEVEALQPEDLPAPYDWPTWTTASCANIAVSYSDEVFDFIPGVSDNCFKIVRTWRVIDWCQYDDDGYEPIIGYQTIKVNNSTPPEITAEHLETVAVTDCVEHNVTFSAQAEDDCTSDEGLEWELYIDINNDAVDLDDYDEKITGMGSEINIVYPLALGEHKVTYIYYDACGNKARKDDVFLVALLLECNTNDIEIFLDENGQASISIDDVYNNSFTNCDVEIALSEDEFGCDAVGVNEVTITLALGNMMETCMAEVTVTDNTPPTITNCSDDDIVLDDTDDGNLDCMYVPGSELDIEATDNCDVVTVTHDYDLAVSTTTLAGTEFAPGTYTITWTATDGSGNPSTCTVTYIVEDNTPPACMDQNPVTVLLGADGTITIDETFLETLPFDECGDVSFDFTNNVFTCDNLGETVTVNYTITDEFNNSSQCSAEFIIEEEINLECNTTNLTFSLGENGSISIDADQVYTITPTSCGREPEVSIDPEVFTCDNIGPNLVTVTVTLDDEILTCPVVITIEDDLPPVIDCPDDPVVIDESDDGVVDCVYTADGSLDVTALNNCDDNLVLVHDYDTAPNMTTLNGATFSLGMHTVTWTATDSEGNSSTCVVNIEIVDNTPPECVDQGPIDVFLGADGTVTVDENDLDIVPIDVCGMATFEFMNNTFDCDDLGMTVDVEYTVTDEAGNTVTCTTPFTINEDFTLECTTIDATVTLDENGMASITSDQVYMVTTTGCGQEPEVDLNKTTFDCDDIGPNTVDITVTLGVQIINCTATVTVEDEIDPTIDCPDEAIEVNDSDDNVIDCQYTAGTELDVSADDNCGETGVTVTHDYTDAPNDNTLNGAEFGIGMHTVTWTAVDGEGNTTTCVVTIIVIDDTAPECVDQGPIEVFLGSDGMVTIDENSLTTLPTDACGDVTFEFMDNVFTCDDLDETVTVTYTVTDEAGNSTTCSTDFIIRENTTLECTTMDITVNLDENGMVTITPDQVYTSNISSCNGNPEVLLSDDTFACNDQGENMITVTITLGDESIECPVTVTVVDPFGPTVECAEIEDITCEEFNDQYNGDPTQFIDDNEFIYDILGCPEMPDNPFVRDTVVIVGLNDCGYGTITRTITITNPMSGLSDQCSQVINIVNDNPVTQDFIDDLNVPETVSVDCGEDTSPSTEIGIITENDFSMFSPCADISVSFDDENPDDACNDPIIREWTIVDECLEDLEAGSGTFTFTQNIFVVDDEGPAISLSMDTVRVMDADFCDMPIDLSGIVTVTDCSGFTVTNNGTGMTDGDDASGIYPFGENEIIYTATDACGNESMDTLILVFDPGDDLISCVKLTYSLPVVDPVSLDVNAAEHIEFGSLNCVDPSDYHFSYNSFDINDTIRTYNCDDENGFYEYSVYYWLDGVVVGSCFTHISINDDDNACPDGFVGVNGTVFTEEGGVLSGFDTHLEGSEYGLVETDENGSFHYDEVLEHRDYQLYAQSDASYRNGVSIIDLVKIQRHILGLDPLNSPYKMIAADVNHDDRLSPMDLLELRKLILHVDNRFKHNSSWRGIPESIEFSDPTSPWTTPFDDVVALNNLTEDVTHNFVGVKIGDVDNTANRGLQPRSSIAMNYVDRNLEVGEISDVSISVPAALNAYGLQLGLRLENAQLLNVSSAYFNDEGIAFHQVDDHNYIITLYGPEAELLRDDVLTFTVEAEAEGSLSDMISVTDRFINAALYTELNESHSIELRADGVEMSYEFAVKQNTPNPWVDKTYIEVMLPESGEVVYNVRDLSGKVVYGATVDMKAGSHAISIDQSQVSVNGVYFVEVKYGNEMKRVRMVKLQ